jgi:DNA repair protein RecO (recombination protein O)
VPTYPLRALVLRKTKLGEADLILTLLAADGRQVRAVAKGARKPKSKLGARVEPFTVLDLLLATGRNLEIVSEAETLSSHDAIRSDYDRSTAAAVVADVLDKVSVEGQVEPLLFEMACVTLDVLESAPVESLRCVVLAFLLKALSMQGYRPTLDECASCAGQLSGTVAFSPPAGGVLCEACSREDAGAMPVSEGARAVLQALMRSRMAEVPALCVPIELESEVMAVLRLFLAYHLPARLRALEYFTVQR